MQEKRLLRRSSPGSDRRIFGIRLQVNREGGHRTAFLVCVECKTSEPLLWTALSSLALAAKYRGGKLNAVARLRENAAPC